MSRDVQRIDFEKVQNTSYSQGFFGTRLGYGNVDISTAGGSGVEMQFQSVPDPRHVQEAINKRVKATRGEPSTESGETKADVLDEILEELRGIRTTLEAQDDVETATGDGAAPSPDETLFDADSNTSTDE
ncbi:PH domain-containing protein [Halobacterium sp. CBA1126]|uniref:PH domain-containing protein n=1 Tax=Halobacterium sp. CBA1126 TaxID=2668074 RepID=UPI0018D1FB82|nr:PH domain-containing protein [Halobacterium sp. CBA1126]